MGFFDFWKKKENTEEKLDYFSNLDKTLLEKKERTRNKENAVIDKIRARILQLTGELRQEISTLENLDLKDVKADQRLKFIVLENLANYVRYLNKLVEDLERVNAPSSEVLIEEIQKIFIEFKNRSQLSKEKSTYLIGKEIRDVKDSIGKFFRDLDDFVQDEKSFFEETTLLKEAINLSKKIKELSVAKLDLEEEKTGLENELESLKENLINVLSHIEEIKDSTEYQDQLNKKEQVKSLKEKLNKELLELKNSIDLKLLAKRYHHEEKKMAVIKEYEGNFSKIISLENRAFLSLLDEQKKKSTEERVELLRGDLEQIKLLIGSKNQAEQLEEEKSNNENRISEITLELEKKQKSLDRFNEEVEGIKNSIKEKLEKVDSKYLRQTF